MEGVIKESCMVVIQLEIPQETVENCSQTCSKGNSSGYNSGRGSFTGVVAVALSGGMNIDEAVHFANIVGAITVTKKGAQTSLPTIEEVEKFKNEQRPEG